MDHRSPGEFGVPADVREGRVGVWVERKAGWAREDKIAAIGVKGRKWVSSTASA